MSDYKKLYYKTFNALTDANELISQASLIIKTAQQECEALYIETDSGGGESPLPLRVVSSK